jgi:hypothetical protein
MHVCIYCRYLDKTTTNEVERVQEVPMTHEKVRERAKRERGRGQKRECVQGRNKCVQEGAGRRRDRHAGERDGKKKTYLSVNFDLILSSRNVELSSRAQSSPKTGFGAVRFLNTKSL